MTLRAVVRAVVRRWYVVVAVFAAAASLYVLFLTGGGVYSTRTTVALMFSYESELTPDNSLSNETVIAFAGTVASTINRMYPAVRYSSADAPYYGAGIREGVLVGLRDEGSQWAPRYGSAVIEIQIVGRTEEWVSEKQKVILTQVDQLARASQLMVGARPEEQIVARVEPLSLEIEHVRPSTVAIVAAASSMLTSAVMVSIWVAVAADRILYACARGLFGGLARGTD